MSYETDQGQRHGFGRGYSPLPFNQASNVLIFFYTFLSYISQTYEHPLAHSSIPENDVMPVF